MLHHEAFCNGSSSLDPVARTLGSEVQHALARHGFPEQHPFRFVLLVGRRVQDSAVYQQGSDVSKASLCIQSGEESRSCNGY